MRYGGMPSIMFKIYKSSFRKRLAEDLKTSKEESYEITKKAKESYRKIIEKLPKFEKNDIFSTNIINCALLIAFLENMNRRPDVSEVTVYYENSMCIWATKLFCKLDAKNKFTVKDEQRMQMTEKLRAGDRNPYSWNMEYLPYADGSGYEARFTSCGICTLMKEYGFYELTPAMCRLDYTMSRLGGKSEFERKYTLALGGPYCDCGYKKK